MPPPSASTEEVGELLGEADESVIERVVETGASIDEIAEALEDLEVERRSGPQRTPSSARILELRHILQDLFSEDDGAQPQIDGVPI
jgi:hypothetical protein